MTDSPWDVVVIGVTATTGRRQCFVDGLADDADLNANSKYHGSWTPLRFVQRNLRLRSSSSQRVRGSKREGNSGPFFSNGFDCLWVPEPGGRERRKAAFMDTSNEDLACDWSRNVLASGNSSPRNYV